MEKIKIPINVGQGLDTKSDPKHVVVGKLTVLENAVFQKKGRIDKRNGFNALGNETLAGTALPAGDGLATFNDELLQYNNQKVYSYSRGVDKFVDKGSAASVIVTSKSIIKNTYSQTAVDSASKFGVTLYAFEDSRGGVRASVYDENTGTPILVDTSIDASGSRPRCISFKDFLYLFYYKSGALYVRRINPKDPVSFDSAVTVYSNVNTTNPTYDVYNYDDIRILWTCNRQTTTGVRAGWLDDAPSVLTGVLGQVDVASQAATNCLSIVKGPGALFFFVFHNTTDGVRAVITNNGLGIAVSSLMVENITASNVVNATGYATSTGVTLFYQVAAAATYNTLIRKNTVTSGGTAGTASDFKRSVGLITKAFSLTGSDSVQRNYVGVVHDSALQASYFVLRDDGLIVAKQQYSLAAGLSTRPILQNVSLQSAGVFTYAILKKTRVISENATLYTANGVARTKLDFSSEDIFQAVQLGKNLHIAGGVLNMYDGESVVEHGFHLYPENITHSDTSSGGSMSNGTYNFAAVYEWTDNQGQRHRSAPSVPSSHTISHGGSSQKITCTVPTLRLTAKDGSQRTNVVIAVYRTEEGPGEIFYRATSITSPNYNDVTADTVAIDLTISDTDLISREILYTTGGVLDNYPAPSCSSIEVYKNRLFLGGIEDSELVFYSKEVIPGEPVEFSEALNISIESEGGPVTALKVLDDKMIIFKKDRFYGIYGDGPNALGTLGEFSLPQFITSDVGSVSGVGLVRSPMGIFFKSEKGIYVLNGSLQASYVGAEVEDFNSQTITSAVLVASTNQVRFTTLAGPVLVFDYFFQQWSTFTGLSSKASVIWQGDYVILPITGRVYVEDSSVFTDAKSSYKLKLATGWIAIDEVSGFQRVSRLFLNGDYKSPHGIRVKIAYDYKEAFEQSLEFNALTGLTLSAYGDSTPYGEEDVYGSLGSAWRFMLYLKKQKCAAIKIQIEELIVREDQNTEQGFNISDMTLLVGVKSGLTRMRNSQTLGIGG